RDATTSTVWSKRSGNFLKRKMSNKTVEKEKEFTVAMQQLSAEAEKILPAMPIVTDDSFSRGRDQTESAPPPEILAEQLQTLENNLLGRIEKLSADMEDRKSTRLNS